MVIRGHARGLDLRLIEPAKPNQNAYVESFNSRVRDECLDGHWFANLLQAQTVIETGAANTTRSSSRKALGGMAPKPYVIGEDQTK